MKKKPNKACQSTKSASQIQSLLTNLTARVPDHRRKAYAEGLYENMTSEPMKERLGVVHDHRELRTVQAAGFDNTDERSPDRSAGVVSGPPWVRTLQAANSRTKEKD